MTITYLSDAPALAAEGQKLHDAYAQNKPWPHIVIDDFIDPDVLSQVQREATAVRRSEYYEKFVDRDALELHLEKPYLQPLFGRIDELLAKPVDIRHLEMLSDRDI